jgi:hypothetical protein
MEKGFFHPNRGYWQTVSEPSQDILDSYPEGTVEVPLKPNADYDWQNGEWVHVPPPDPTPEELRALMPNKSMVEFRAALRSIRTEAVPNGIYAADINAKISEIIDLDLQEEAQDYFNLGQYAERLNPWVDILGAMFALSPEEIDFLWAS